MRAMPYIESTINANGRLYFVEVDRRTDKPFTAVEVDEAKATRRNLGSHPERVDAIVQATGAAVAWLRKSARS